MGPSSTTRRGFSSGARPREAGPRPAAVHYLHSLDHPTCPDRPFLNPGLVAMQQGADTPALDSAVTLYENVDRLQVNQLRRQVLAAYQWETRR